MSKGPPPRSAGASKQKAERSLVERKVILPAQQFIHTETVGGIVLLAAALIALAWASSPWSPSYHHLFEEIYPALDFGVLEIRESLKHWINDGLMVTFFFVVGLEVKRELVCGELSSLKRAALPVVAALGGMLVPAAIYYAINFSGDGADGWGVPMATDIAFALGVLALAGDRVPMQARVLLLALAAVDDIGAILVIAIFYSTEISVPWLVASALLIAGVVGLRSIGMRDIKFYLIGAFAVWVAVLESGVHATIAGVALGLLTPSGAMFSMEKFRDELGKIVDRFQRAFDRGDKEEAEVEVGKLEALTVESEAPLDRRMRLTHPWSAFFVLPLFALANAGVELSMDALSDASTSMVAIGIVAGLIGGKLLGILGFSALAVRMGFASLPQNVTWRHVAGVAMTAGIGFTVSLFITELAFTDEQMVKQAKIGIVAASAVAGLAGLALLRYAPAPE